ncbi:MAG: fatty acid desaturase, partial [Cyclobacteriaceae bacterium]|nr:fatty acid desaturase [Cyclobacteriaceae bacterium]
DNGNIIRLSPYSKWHSFHRFQHIYSWFLYTLGTLSWVTLKDFKQFFVYKRENYVKDRKEFWRQLIILIGTKGLYYGYIFVIPLIFTPWTFWQIIIGFLLLHFVSGFILSVTFQLAHIVEENAHETGEKEVIDNSWAAHQVLTTANFSRKSKFLNWYLGGLNFQIEHHLFPHICHIHYSKLSDIVKKTIREHGMEYREFGNMFDAMKSHYKALKSLSVQ